MWSNLWSYNISRQPTVWSILVKIWDQTEFMYWIWESNIEILRNWQHQQHLVEKYTTNLKSQLFCDSVGFNRGTENFSFCYTLINWSCKIPSLMMMDHCYVPYPSAGISPEHNDWLTIGTSSQQWYWNNMPLLLLSNNKE